MNNIPIPLFDNVVEVLKQNTLVVEVAKVNHLDNFTIWVAGQVAHTIIDLNMDKPDLVDRVLDTCTSNRTLCRYERMWTPYRSSVINNIAERLYKQIRGE